MPRASIWLAVKSNHLNGEGLVSELGDGIFAVAAKVRNPPILLKNNVLRAQKAAI